jgi:hypothetical protein
MAFSFETAKMRCCIDFASPYSIHGWAYDKATGAFPERLGLQGGEASIVPVPVQSTYSRDDVSSTLGIAPGAQLAFSLNLFDVFNGRVNDYAITLDGSRIWSLMDSLSARVRGDVDPPRPKEWGRRLVLFVVEDGDPLDTAIMDLLHWQKNVFVKKFNSGISFAACHANDARSRLEEAAKSDAIIYLVTMRNNYRNCAGGSEIIHEKVRPILIDDSQKSYSGNLGWLPSLSFAAEASEDKTITAESLLSLMSTLSGYADLYFSNQIKLFTLKGGHVSDRCVFLISRNHQEKSSKDLVIVQYGDVRRLSDVTDENTAIFVNVSGLFKVIDLMKQDNQSFLRTALTRNIDHQIVRLDESELPRTLTELDDIADPASERRAQ